MKRLALALVLLALAAVCPARAQVFYVTSCGTVPGSLTTPVASNPGLFFVDTTGKLCVNASVSASISGFAPGGSYATLSASTVSSNVALPTGAVVIVYNTGSVAASVKLGTANTVTATTSNDQIPAGGWMAFTVGSNTFLAGVTASSTASLVLSGGTGLPTGSGGGSGGGGGGGAVTIASGGVASGAYASGSLAIGAGTDGWNATEGTKADSAYTSGSGSIIAILKGIFTGVTGAIPAGTNVVGFTSNDPCSQATKLGAPISLTASGQVITGTASKKTYICSIDVISATAQNIALVEGTGTTCATNIFGLAGGTTAATGWNLAANGGLTKGSGAGTVYSPSGDANATAANVCLLLSSTGQTSGQITYVQQ